MTNNDTALSGSEALAVANLQLARRHARTLERLAVLAPILAAVAFLALAPADGVSLGIALVAGSVLVWAVLRALALRLHLVVDERLLAADEPA